MISIEQFNARFLDFKVGLIIESDSPMPENWNLVLPLQFSPGLPGTTDFTFRMSLRIRSETKRQRHSLRLPFFKNDRMVWFTKGSRHILFKDESQINIDKPYRSARLSGPSRWYLACEIIESWLGWEVETRGFVRLHGLMIKGPSQTALLIARQGFGKTTLALNCLKNQMQIIGEEVIYAKSGLIHPVRTVLREKVSTNIVTDENVVTIRFGQRRLHFPSIPSQSSVPLNSFYYGVRSERRLWPLACGFDVVIGLGLPQNLDFTVFPLCPTSWFGWSRILWQRIVFLCELKNVRCKSFLRKNDDAVERTAAAWQAVLCQDAR